MLTEVLGLFILKFHWVQPYAQAYFLTSLGSWLILVYFLFRLLACFVCLFSEFIWAWTPFTVFLYLGIFLWLGFNVDTLIIWDCHHLLLFRIEALVPSESRFVQSSFVINLDLCSVSLKKNQVNINRGES